MLFADKLISLILGNTEDWIIVIVENSLAFSISLNLPVLVADALWIVADGLFSVTEDLLIFRNIYTIFSPLEPYLFLNNYKGGDRGRRTKWKIRGHLHDDGESDSGPSWARCLEVGEPGKDVAASWEWMWLGHLGR